jgi:tetratricopeptide (TPR) repeat protein
MEKSTNLLPYALIMSIVVASCGCIFMSPMMSEEDHMHFAEEINASQGYYDTLVKEDSLNATAWCIRGNYYNNAFGQYEEALQSYNRSLELNPEYGYAWFSKGVTLRNMGYYNESRECFEKSPTYDPTLRRVIGQIEQ